MNKIEEIYAREYTGVFLSAVEYIMLRGFDDITGITDKRTCHFEPGSLERAIIQIARDIVDGCKGNPLRLISFCTERGLCDGRAVSYHRMSEIATNALTYLEDNDLLADFEADWGSMSEPECEYFGVHVGRGDDDGDWDWDAPFEVIEG